MYVPGVRQMFYLAGVRHVFEPIEVMKIVLHHADSCSLKVFCVALFNKNYIFVYILKTKSIK